MGDTQGKMSNLQRADLEFSLNYHLQPNHTKKVWGGGGAGNGKETKKGKIKEGNACFAGVSQCILNW